jgi:exopolyphosphatase/guanosine-5'-triphosphate,3'-diphosphate pyrophosphatase
LRSRSPRHGIDLGGWTDEFMKSAQLDETSEEKRLRRAACLLADIAWRAHPDYRSDQALNMIANGTFVGVDHPGRGFLALAVTYRHISIDDDVSPQLRALVSPRLLDRARILGASMRVAYLISAAMADVLPRCPLRCVKSSLVLELPAELADLASERLAARLRQLGKLIGRSTEIRAV